MMEMDKILTVPIAHAPSKQQITNYAKILFISHVVQTMGIAITFGIERYTLSIYTYDISFCGDYRILKTHRRIRDGLNE